MSHATTIEIAFGYRPGCIGHITALHAGYMHVHCGFDVRFEVRTATELSSFLLDFEAERGDGLWLALGSDERVVGCIAVVHKGPGLAKVRWFQVDEAWQGQGIGGMLMAAAMKHCDKRGYSRVVLDTHAGLVAARRMYDKFGFRIYEEEKVEIWGATIRMQHMERVMRGDAPALHALDG